MTHYSNSTPPYDIEIPPGTNASKEVRLKYELALVRQQSLEIVRKEKQGILDLLTYAQLTIAAWQINGRIGRVDDF